jgi:hypothetical protein
MMFSSGKISKLFNEHDVKRSTCGFIYGIFPQLSRQTMGRHKNYDAG